MSKTNLSIYGKFTPRSSKSIYITDSINLPSASPIPWRVSSFIPCPSSSLYARKVARNQFVQALIVRLFGQGNQFLNDTLLLLIKNQPKLGPAVFCNFQHSSNPLACAHRLNRSGGRLLILELCFDSELFITFLAGTSITSLRLQTLLPY